MNRLPRWLTIGAIIAGIHMAANIGLAIGLMMTIRTGPPNADLNFLLPELILSPAQFFFSLKVGPFIDVAFFLLVSWRIFNGSKTSVPWLVVVTMIIGIGSVRLIATSFLLSPSKRNCDAMLNIERKAACFGQLARRTNNPEYCSLDFSPDLCYQQVATQTQDREPCSKIRDMVHQAQCLAEVTGEWSYCEALPEQRELGGGGVEIGVRGNCILGVARTKGDASICRQIQDEFVYQNCIVVITGKTYEEVRDDPEWRRQSLQSFPPPQ